MSHPHHQVAHNQAILLEQAKQQERKQYKKQDNKNTETITQDALSTDKKELILDGTGFYPTFRSNADNEHFSHRLTIETGLLAHALNIAELLASNPRLTSVLCSAEISSTENSKSPKTPSSGIFICSS